MSPIFGCMLHPIGRRDSRAPTSRVGRRSPGATRSCAIGARRCDEQNEVRVRNRACICDPLLPHRPLDAALSIAHEASASTSTKDALASRESASTRERSVTRRRAATRGDCSPRPSSRRCDRCAAPGRHSRRARRRYQRERARIDLVEVLDVPTTKLMRSVECAWARARSTTAYGCATPGSVLQAGRKAALLQVDAVVGTLIEHLRGRPVRSVAADRVASRSGAEVGAVARAVLLP